MSSNRARGAAQAVDPAHFCRACAKFATGVTVVTVLDRDGVPHGMTANSFTSVSLDPPLVLVCVDERAGILAHFQSSEHMGVNVLNSSQVGHSVHFSRSGEDRFGSVEWYAGETGVPLLPEVLATLECAITQRLRAGDHTILIGEVRHAAYRDGMPLLFFNSEYRSVT